MTATTTIAESSRLQCPLQRTATRVQSKQASKHWLCNALQSHCNESAIDLHSIGLAVFAVERKRLSADRCLGRLPSSGNPLPRTAPESFTQGRSKSVLLGADASSPTRCLTNRFVLFREICQTQEVSRNLNHAVCAVASLPDSWLS